MYWQQHEPRGIPLVCYVLRATKLFLSRDRVTPCSSHPRTPHSIGAAPLPKKPNYDFEKRRKELDRKKKKETKREERLQRGHDETTDDQGEPAQQTARDGLAGTEGQV